jgi:hypothetical protein
MMEGARERVREGGRVRKKERVREGEQEWEREKERLAAFIVHSSLNLVSDLLAPPAV